MKKRTIAAIIFSLAALVYSQPGMAFENDQPANAVSIDPPLLPNYQKERRDEDTKKYIDPILQPGVDISALELDAMRRRQSLMEAKIDTLQTQMKQVITLLNQMNGEPEK